MAFDINNGYSGNLLGRDRIGHTTPDAEATECLRPWLPVPYPAPYLPTLRQDQGHPVLANVVLSSQYLVGQDKSGAFVPAGLFCGTQPQKGTASITNRVLTANVATFTAANILTEGQSVTISGYSGGDAFLNGTYGVDSATATDFVLIIDHANVTTGAGTGTPLAGPTNAGKYCAIKYSSSDVGFASNALTGNPVAAAGEVAVLAAPVDGVAGDIITFADGTTYTVTSGDVTAALACNLFSGGRVKPVGLTLRNVFQYLGGVSVSSTTGGMAYTLNGVLPVKFKIHNYMHEMGTAIQTQMVIRLPWIGATPSTLATLASGDSVTGYIQSNYSRSFVHFTGTPTFGAMVMGSPALGDSGNYSTWDGVSVSDICGRIYGIQNVYPIRDFANRVRTLWDPSRLVGPIKDPNPSSIMMGGSATGGIDYQLNLGTDGIFKKAFDQGKTIHAEYTTYVLVKVGACL